MKVITAICLIVGLVSAKPAIEEIDVSNIFKVHKGTIVIYDSEKDRYFIHNTERSRKSFTPFSTFKIPNSIIAIETGVIENTDTEFQWDSASYPNESWWPKQWPGRHTMRSAIKYSVVPFYREIASKVGKVRMQAFVDKFDYGNRDISSGEDNFWLNGSLSISAMEQVAFLRKFYKNELGVSPGAVAAVKDILIQEETERYRLSAKTGGGTGFDKANPDKALGWYVGYVEKGKNLYYFAMNIEGESFSDIITPRKEISIEVLKYLKIIE